MEGGATECFRERVQEYVQNSAQEWGKDLEGREGPVSRRGWVQE